MDSCQNTYFPIDVGDCIPILEDSKHLDANKTQFNGFQTEPCSVYPIKVGIFGCSHGDDDVLEQVMKEMRDRGVSKVIANGDFVSFLGLEGLEKSLKTVHSVFPKFSEPECNRENVYIMPGNWDHTTMVPEQANGVMEKYGQLVTKEYDSFGRVCINGKTIQVAHFPQHPLPRKYLPPDEFLYRPVLGQAHFFGTMSKQMNDLSSVDFNVVGHSHIHTHFYDTTSKTLTYSPGGLSDRKKDDQKKGFGIYNTDTGIVSTYSVEKDNIGKYHISELNAYPDHICDVSGEFEDIFNIKDPKICGLDHEKVSRCVNSMKSFEQGFLDAINPAFQSKLSMM